MNIFAAAELVNNLRSIARQEIVNDRIAGEVDTARELLVSLERNADLDYLRIFYTELAGHVQNRIYRKRERGESVYESFERGEMNVINVFLGHLAKTINTI